MLVSNNSDLSRVEKVRLASSAAQCKYMSVLKLDLLLCTHFSGNAAPHEEFASLLSKVWQVTHRHVVS